MAGNFVKISDVRALDDLITSSSEAPVLIFKHSSSCPISARAYREMESISHEVNIVVIQESRAISDEIEERTGVDHETPQVILLREGKAVWTASHSGVTAAAVARQLP